MAKVFSKKLKKLIDESETVSFDIFDTLIKRNCNKPRDIFKFVEKIYYKNSGEKIFDFYNKRIAAEQKARSEINCEDVSLDDIYKCLPYDENKCNKLKQIEIECELQLCQKNLKLCDIYNYCKASGKKIICISDMYLSEKVLNEMLEKNGYNVDKIYVSSEYKATKLSGNLFKIAIKETKSNKEKFVHIGDSWKADFLSPFRLGIKSHHIKKVQKNCKYLKFNKKNAEIIQGNLNVNLLSSFINNNTIELKNDYEKLGFEVIGPFCLMFATWIKNCAKKNGINNLLFCARDMKMIHEIYSMFYGDDIKSSYFYVSRKSTYLPYLYLNNNYDEFKKLFPKSKRKITIDELLSMYNIVIDNKELNLILKKFSLSNGKIDLEDSNTQKQLKKLYDEYINKIIDIDGKKQYELFIKYLKKLDCSSKTAIVDLGWRGTTQSLMINILNENLYGMYLGLHSLYGSNLNDNYYTYLFSNKSDDYSKKIYPIMSICELTLSALHGSTLKYTDSNSNPAILGKSANLENQFILAIQNGAIKFCKSIRYLREFIDYDENLFFANNYIKMGINPNYEQAKIIGDIYTENIKIRKLCEYKSVMFYAFHPKQLKIDFLDSEWKIGFLKRMLKIPLPYYNIYNYLKKKSGD